MAKCTFQSGAGSPVGVAVPKFIGQLYHDTVADAYYRSTGLTNSDWVFIGGGAPFVEWLPHTEVATWSDAGGIGQIGDYTSFLATVDLGSLSSLSLASTAITSLTCNNCPSLSNLSCESSTGPLTALNVSGSVALNTLNCRQNPSLTTITGIASCAALVTLLGNNCDITGTFDMSGKTNLTNLVISINPNLTGLIVTGCVSLTQLVCLAVSITALDVSTCTSLTQLFCSYNSINSLTLTGCTQLTNLDCGYNALSTLDISPCAVLSTFNCSYNLLTTGPGGSVNIILTDMVANNPPVGIMFMQGQTPAAPPDAGPPDGATAKTTLIGLGWVVTTD